LFIFKGLKMALHLPHKDEVGYYQFITFRTHDSTAPYLQKLLNQRMDNSKKQLAVDQYLDSSKVGAYLNDTVLLYLHRFFKDLAVDSYRLAAFTIMPNHVHLLLMPNSTLSTLMHKIKGSSAKRINEILGRKGQFWSQDYYDKLIRDEQHFWCVYNYIKNNPMCLVDKDNRFYGCYENE
jgi:REP element-mobilizing transposase RayT